MPRKRKAENKGLPERWRYAFKAYYYQVPKGLEYLWDDKQTFKLGRTLPEAYKTWAERIGVSEKANKIKELLDRYALEVTPNKAVSSQQQDPFLIRSLKMVFGDMRLTDIKPQHIYQYHDKRSRKHSTKDGRITGGSTAARHEIALLSHAYTKAVEWGYINKHPFKGEVRLKAPTPRDRYIEDWELQEFLSLKTDRKKGGINVIHSYIRIKLLTGLRRGDLLRLKVSDCQEDGIHVKTQKTKKPVIYEWTEELKDAYNSALQARPVHISPYLFCTRRGESYMNNKNATAYGWNSLWQRFMDRVLTETKVTERFTEHDLRAKCASDAESLERARQLLSHTDSKTTKRIYMRKPEKIKPAK